MHKLGWIPDLPDRRDRRYKLSFQNAVNLPPSVDLTSLCPPVYDQGQTSSCTANALAAAFEFDLMKQALPVFSPSRLFIYWNERVIENSTDSDSGAMIRDGIKTIAAQGVCDESLWPFDPAYISIIPNQSCFDQATQFKAIAYQRLENNIDQLKGCLYSGTPVAVGFTVYESFETDIVAQTGTATMPLPSERALGGHAVLLVGYDDSTQRWKLRNSWGPLWGDSGMFTLPYGYLLDDNLADDFWQMSVVT